MTAQALLLNVLLITLACNCTACLTNREQEKPAESGFVPPKDSRTFHLKETGGQIDLTILYGNLSVSDDSIVNWVQNAAKAVTAYFGHYPARQLRIVIEPGGSSKIGEGVTTEDGILVKIGPGTQQADLNDDWVMTHEMFHVAFPDLDNQYVWLQEGLASYLEPLARVRLGFITPERLWGDMVEGMPEGQPEPGDKGLDHTHTWGRTYWGGSMFCLQADLRIRDLTNNRKSLDDAMRAILEQGGDHLRHWTIEKVIDVGDRATGTTVLRDLYNQMCCKPVTYDLDGLWRRLGVKYENGKVTFNDNAPMAAIRRSMTARVPEPQVRRAIFTCHARVIILHYTSRRIAPLDTPRKRGG